MSNVNSGIVNPGIHRRKFCITFKRSSPLLFAALYLLFATLLSLGIISAASFPQHLNSSVDIPQNLYTIDEFVAGSAIAAAFTGTVKNTGQLVTLKQINRGAAEDAGRRKNVDEIKKLQLLLHPGIPKFLSWYVKDDTHLVVVVERQSASSIASKSMASVDGCLRTHEVVRVFVEAIAALDYAHERGIIHENIRPDNILWPNQEDGVIQIADFGFSLFGSLSPTSGIASGSAEQFMSPEVLQKMNPFAASRSPITAAADMWSLAATLLKVATGVGVARDQHVDEYKSDLSRICDEKQRWSFEEDVLKRLTAESLMRWTALPSYLRQIISMSMRRKVSDRPSAAAIVRSVDYRELMPSKLSTTAAEKDAAAQKHLDDLLAPYLGLRPFSKPMRLKTITSALQMIVDISEDVLGEFPVRMQANAAVSVLNMIPKFIRENHMRQRVICRPAVLRAIAHIMLAYIAFPSVAIAAFKSLNAIAQYGASYSTASEKNIASIGGSILTAAIIRVLDHTGSTDPMVATEGCRLIRILCRANEENIYKFIALGVQDKLATLSTIFHDDVYNEIEAAKRNLNRFQEDVSVLTYKVHSDGVRCLFFTKNGRSLISLSTTLSQLTWDENNFLRKKMEFTPQYMGDKFQALAIAIDYGGTGAIAHVTSLGSLIISQGQNSIRIRSWYQPFAGGRFEWNRKPQYAVVFSPMGRTLASGGNNFEINLWEVSHFDEYFRQKNLIEADISQQYISSAEEFRWKPNGLTKLIGHTDSIRSLSFTRDDLFLASASDDTTIRIWDVAGSATCLHVLKGHTDKVLSVSFSPNDQMLASGSADGTVRLWDPMTGAVVDILQGHGGAVHCVAFSPDGRELAAGLTDMMIAIWDVKTRKLLRVLTGHEGAVTAVAYSPQGDRLASGSADKTVRVWMKDWFAPPLPISMPLRPSL